MRAHAESARRYVSLAVSMPSALAAVGQSWHWVAVVEQRVGGNSEKVCGCGLHLFPKDSGDFDGMRAPGYSFRVELVEIAWSCELLRLTHRSFVR